MLRDELQIAGDGAEAERFDRLTIALHWLALLLLVALFASAWARSLAEDAATAGRLLALHRACGLLLWALTVARIAWRVTRADRPQAPLPRAQRLAASATQFALYALLIAQPALGLAHSLFRGKPFDLLVATVPALVPRDADLSHRLHGLHEQAAWLLLALVGLHAGAALFHRFVLRDAVLQSMLPWRGRRPLSAGE
jgi:cytochrome b561